MSERRVGTRMLGVVGFLSAALMLAGAARAGLIVGVSEDAGKAGDGGAAFFATMTDLGLNENRVTINWDPTRLDAIPAQTELNEWMPQATTLGTKIVFAVAPLHPRDLTSSPDAPSHFAAFLQQVAQTFP